MPVYQCMRSAPSESNHQGSYLERGSSLLAAFLPSRLLLQSTCILLVKLLGKTAAAANSDTCMLMNSQTANCIKKKRFQVKKCVFHFVILIYFSFFILMSGPFLFYSKNCRKCFNKNILYLSIVISTV